MRLEQLIMLQCCDRCMLEQISGQFVQRSMIEAETASVLGSVAEVGLCSTVLLLLWP